MIINKSLIKSAFKKCIDPASSNTYYPLSENLSILSNYQALKNNDASDQYINVRDLIGILRVLSKEWDREVDKFINQ